MNRKGFTLVELLAVIVILAVILVIAVPQISDVIKNTKIASLENSLRLIIGEAETKYETNKLLGKSTSNIICDSVSNLSDRDYENCTISYDDSGNATVTLNGKTGGKFENISCSGTKNSITCQEESEEIATDASCFTTVPTISSYTINYDLCMETINDESSCTGTLFKGMMSFLSLAISMRNEYYPQTSYGYLENIEYNNLSITGYDLDCPKNVVIPETINGKNVVEIAPFAFLLFNPEIGLEGSLDITNIKFPDNLRVIGNYALGINKLSKVTIPKNVEAIGVAAFSGNQINELNFAEDIRTGINELAFSDNLIKKLDIPVGIFDIGNRSFENNLIDEIIFSEEMNIIIEEAAFQNNKLKKLTIPNGEFSIGNSAFTHNEITEINFPTTPITIASSAFSYNPIMDDGNFTYPSNVTISGS